MVQEVCVWWMIEQNGGFEGDCEFAIRCYCLRYGVIGLNNSGRKVLVLEAVERVWRHKAIGKAVE